MKCGHSVLIWLLCVGAVFAQEAVPVPAPTGIEPSASASDQTATLPDRGPALAALHIPAEVISREASETFRHTSPVDRVILGTHSRGTAYCVGTVNCVLEERATGAEFVCYITGTITSATRGVNGPAVICSTANTRYTAVKRIVFEGRQLTTHPAVLSANTQVQITGIGSSSPGVRGRIVRRVASRRASESLPEAEAITRQLTMGELQQHIDSEFSRRLGLLNRKLARRLAILEAFSQGDYQLSIRSQREFIEVLLKQSVAANSSDSSPSVARANSDQSPSEASSWLGQRSVLEAEAVGLESTVPPDLPLSEDIVLWLPLPEIDLRDLATGNWNWSDALQLVPTWLSTPLGQFRAPAERRPISRLDLLRHKDWIGFQLHADAGAGAGE